MAKIFNLENALKITDHDYDLLQEIIQLFKSEKINMLNAIDIALQSESLEAIKRSAHSIKGSLANVGADICSELALQIEHTETHENIQNSVELFEQLKIEIEKYLDETKKKLSSVNQ